MEREVSIEESTGMAKNSIVMYDYARPSLNEIETSIVRPTIAKINFKIKPNVISMFQNLIQFERLQDEDPNTYISSFLEICGTFKMNITFDDAIRL